MSFFRSAKRAALCALVLSAGAPSPGAADLYVHFLVDRSGSMWTPLAGAPKIESVMQGITKALEELPPEVAVGLRVYPPPYGEGQDPGLRVRPLPGGRETFAEELRQFNPKGSAPLAEHLAKALGDFPAGDHGRILLLICDSSDLQGASFCDGGARFRKVPEGLRLHILALNVEDAAEQNELNCLAGSLSGEILYVGNDGSLPSSVASICRKAYQEETDRQKRIAEERRRLEELLSKTRVRLEFHNTLDPFFADAVEIIDCRIGDRALSLPPPSRLAPNESRLLADVSVAAGDHLLVVRYKKRKGEQEVISREASFLVTVRDGETTHIRCFPRGGLFHWGCRFKDVSS
ncbi:MAG: hypothetical protein AB1640_13295 [bacterium]